MLLTEAGSSSASVLILRFHPLPFASLSLSRCSTKNPPANSRLYTFFHPLRLILPNTFLFPLDELINCFFNLFSALISPRYSRGGLLFEVRRDFSVELNFRSRILSYFTRYFIIIIIRSLRSHAPEVINDHSGIFNSFFFNYIIQSNVQISRKEQNILQVRTQNNSKIALLKY